MAPSSFAATPSGKSTRRELTPRIIEAIRARAAAEIRFNVLLFGGLYVVAILIAVVVYQAAGLATVLRDLPWVPPAFIAFETVTIGAILYSRWRAITSGIERDLADRTYISVTGLIELTFEDGSTGPALHLSDGGVTKDSKAGWAVRKAEINAGTVDYLPHSGLVLEVRDEADRPVYTMPGYRPGS